MGRSRNSCRPEMPGLSLLELLVTLAIIGILALIGVPAYDGMIEAQRLRAAAEALAADLRWARSEAIKRGVPVRFACTGGGHWSCSVVADADGNGSFDDAPLKLVAAADFPSVSLAASFGGNAQTLFEPVRATASAGELVLSAASLSARVSLSAAGAVGICGPRGYPC